MHSFARITLIALATTTCGVQLQAEETAVHIRANQLGYRPDEAKVALAFSNKPLTGTFSLLESESGDVSFSERLVESAAPGWGTFSYCYRLISED